MTNPWDSFLGLMSRGGWVMWPLLGLSLVAATLIVERAWFYAKTNGGKSRKRLEHVAKLLRRGDHAAVHQVVAGDDTVYGDAVRRLLDEPPSEASAAEAIEAQRHRLERFMPTLSTIITAAPMLGILGTVLGIIGAFRLLDPSGAAAPNPEDVSDEIAEALITTAAGLLIAVVTLFPYNALRAQIDRSLSRLEALAAAAISRAPRPESASPADA